MDLSNILFNSPGFIFWKNKRSEYLGGNENFLSSSGYNNIDNVIGKPDEQFPWQHLAKHYRESDMSVMAGNVITGRHIVHSHANNQSIKVIYSKSPLYDLEKLVIGVVCSYQVMQPLNRTLPIMQEKCLTLLARGLSIKEIARELNLSPRTVDFYFTIIKEKLSCNNRAELILKAYAMALI